MGYAHEASHCLESIQHCVGLSAHHLHVVVHQQLVLGKCIISAFEDRGFDFLNEEFL